MNALRTTSRIFGRSITYAFIAPGDRVASTGQVPSNSNSTATITGVKRGPITQQHVPSGRGVVLEERCTYSINAEDCVVNAIAFVPKPGDTITEDGATRAVVEVNPVAGGGVYQCVCKNVRRK